MDALQMYVGGVWTDSSSGEVITTINPATKEPIATFPRGNQDDVDRAVKAARATFESGKWREILPAERGRMLLQPWRRERWRRDDVRRLPQKRI